MAQSMIECLAVDQLDDERPLALELLNPVESGDAGMVERCEHAGFALEAVETISIGGESRRENLERDVASEPRISGPKDLAHAAGAKHGLNFERAEARSRRKCHSGPDCSACRAATLGRPRSIQGFEATEMRKTVLLALTLLFVPGLGAAVLPGPQKIQKAQIISSPVGLRSERSAPSAALEFQSAPSPAYRGEWTADTYNTWRGDDGEPRVQFNLRTSSGDSRWGFGVRLRDLVGFPPAAVANLANDIQFTWTREAGTFRFNGSFEQGRGSGTYTFTQDQTFVNHMAGAGYKNLTADDIVRLAVVDVTIAHVRGLAQAGYPKLPLDDVVRTRIHRVTPEFIRDLAAVGYKSVPVDDLVRMAIHGATPANIKALQDAGIRGQSVEDLIRFRIHKVTPEFITALAARGYKSVAAEDLVKMRIHNVSPEEMDQLKTLGFGGLDVDTLVKFRIHKVTPEYIKSMKDVGYVTVSEDQLVRMRIHKVDARFVRDARADGFALQTPGDAVDLAIHGPRWKRKY
jgi:hypothetical protein